MNTIKQDLQALLIMLLVGAALYPLVRDAARNRVDNLLVASGELPKATTSPVVRQSEIGPAADPTRTAQPTAPTKQAPYRKGKSSQLHFPVAGYGSEHIISVFGDPRGSDRRHQGIDIKAPQGTPVVAVEAGTVERVGESERGGKQVWIRATGHDRLYFYGHLHNWAVAADDAVVPGDIIGYVGSTGNATTPHLHFEVLKGDRQPVDPMDILFPGA